MESGQFHERSLICLFFLMYKSGINRSHGTKHSRSKDNKYQEMSKRVTEGVGVVSQKKTKKGLTAIIQSQQTSL